MHIPFESYKRLENIEVIKYILIFTMNNNFDKLAKLAINKSLLKEYSNSEYSRIVYMKDNSEFQIQIFNPYSYNLGVEITINSTRLSNMLVIRPGERIWLERYLDENRKFLFNTYEVENSQDAKRAIAKNGNVELYFYKEKQPNIYFTDNRTYFHDYPWNKTDWNYYTTTCTFNASDSIQATAANTVLTSNLDNATCAFANYSVDTNFTAPNIETGRIEKGSHSNQDLMNVNIEFESFFFRTEKIKILPIHKNHCISLIL